MNDIVTPKQLKAKQVVRIVSCRVLLNNIEVMADIGALAKELGVPQPLKIDVALEVVTPQIDHLSQTFDYSQIRDFAVELANQRIVLIEVFAQKLARRCLASDVVHQAEVWIAKPKAVPGCMAGTHVKLIKG
jgi:dihydroneopterin aldolase